MSRKVPVRQELDEEYLRSLMAAPEPEVQSLAAVPGKIWSPELEEFVSSLQRFPPVI